MKDLEFGVNAVLKEVPRAFAYFLIGAVSGAVAGEILFAFNNALFAFIIELWSRRLLFGLDFITKLTGGKNYTLWFVVNNLAVMLVVIAASVFILTRISSRNRLLEKRLEKRFGSRFKNLKKFRDIEKRRPRMTVNSLYMIPVGALIVNGFLIALFAMYVFLNYSAENFSRAILLLLPHGINEIAALVLASSLGLSYLKIISPMVMKGRMNEAIKVGGQLLKTKATFYILAIIFMLIVFSGFIEGTLSLFAL